MDHLVVSTVIYVIGFSCMMAASMVLYAMVVGDFPFSDFDTLIAVL